MKTRLMMMGWLVLSVGTMTEAQAENFHPFPPDAPTIEAEAQAPSAPPAPEARCNRRHGCCHLDTQRRAS